MDSNLYYLRWFACGNDLKLNLAKKVQIVICSFQDFLDFAQNTLFSKWHSSQITQPILKFLKMLWIARTQMVLIGTFKGQKSPLV